MKNLYLIAILCLASCTQSPKALTAPKAGEAKTEKGAFAFESERIGELQVMRYQLPGFEKLDLQRKKLAYYLYEAALSGREIIYDQRYRYNLMVKRTLEEVVKHYPGDRTTADFTAFMEYVKRFWFASGMHHHYSHEKFVPTISYEVFAEYVRDTTRGSFPLRDGQSLDQLLEELKPVIFDQTFESKLVNKDRDADLIADSAVNYYQGLTQKEVEDFYAARRDDNDPTPPSHGLNSRLVKQADGTITEQTWMVGGLYGEALEKICYWLDKAVTVAENDAQRDALQKLVTYFRSGELRDFDAYNIAWVKDTESELDTINGFIEVYNDPMGFRGSYESIVSYRDPIATERIRKIADEAQWFENNAPIMDEHKKAEVKGITGRAINVIVEGGDASPTTPIGINLPNANWIRKDHGSKSVNLANIVNAYSHAQGGSLKEFAWSEEEIARNKKYGELADNLHTDMHEVIGHASGQLNPGVGTPKETLKNYSSTMEEARADLVALYYLMDEKLIELGVMDSLDVGKTAYDDYIRNGMMLQLRRLKPGEQIEEDHMRNRQLIAAWAVEKGAGENVVEKKQRDGKTFFVINDYAKLRDLFGQLLREIQRIKSEGDFAAMQALVETYGVKVDEALHAEVLERYAALDTPAYKGFINPRLVPVMEGEEIIDVTVEYPDDFTGQMLEYAKNYAFLPNWNGGPTTSEKTQPVH